MNTKINLNIGEKFLKCLFILSFILMSSLSFGQSAEIVGEEYVILNGEGEWGLYFYDCTDITSIEWSLDNVYQPYHGIMYWQEFPSALYYSGWHRLDCTVTDGETIIYCEPFYFELGW